MTRPSFNRNAALLGALTAFVAFQAYVLGYTKACETHFDLPGMLGWLLFGNLFLWVLWVPLTLVCALLWGLFVVGHTPKTYRLLAWVLVAASILAFIVAFIVTPYGRGENCVI